MLRVLINCVALATPATAKALSFTSPYEQRDWVLTGDARVSESGVDLVHSPGQAGAVWAKAPVTSSEWTLEVELSSKTDIAADAADSGYTLWYVSTPQANPGDTSVRGGAGHGGADSWDGLAVMVDNLAPHENAPGSVRGHLNDGTTKFSSLGDLSNEAISLCRLDYRRVSTPMLLQIGYSPEDGFVVAVGQQKCFLTTEVSLPAGYFGVSANSASTKDVLTVHRLAIRDDFDQSLLKMLPDHADIAPSGSESGANSNANKGSASGSGAHADDDSVAWKGPTGISKDETLDLMRPTMDRVEMIEVMVKQVRSAIDQLGDTLSISMSHISSREDSAAGSSGDGPDLSGLQKEISSLRGQILDWQRTAAGRATTSGGSVTVSNSKSTLWLVLVLVPVQFCVIFVYHGWLSRRERHEKLL